MSLVMMESRHNNQAYLKRLDAVVQQRERAFESGEKSHASVFEGRYSLNTEMPAASLEVATQKRSPI